MHCIDNASHTVETFITTNNLPHNSMFEMVARCPIEVSMRCLVHGTTIVVQQFCVCLVRGFMRIGGEDRCFRHIVQ